MVQRQLHEDKEEFVQVSGPKLPILCGVNHVRSGSWVEGADEAPPPFTRRYVMETRNQPSADQPINNLVAEDKNIWVQVDAEGRAGLDITTGSCCHRNQRHNKGRSACVTRPLMPPTVFRPNNKPLRGEEGGNQHQAPKRRTVGLPCVHVRTSCEWF